MRRKIILHGPSSMTISLPSNWVKSNNLKKGEELEVIEENGFIIIKPIHENSEIKSTEISFIGLEKDVRKDFIMALHKKGYDEIKISIDNHNGIKELHEFLNTNQLGFEIIRHESNKVTIKNISNPGSDQFENLFRRIYRMTIEYAKKVEAIIEDKEEITTSCFLHETSINRISNYCKRIVVKEKRMDACFYYSIIEELNSLTSNITALLDEFGRKQLQVPKKYASKYTEATDLLINVYTLHYKFSNEEYIKLKNISESLKVQILEIQTKNSAENIYWDYLDAINSNISTLLEAILVLQF